MAGMGNGLPDIGIVFIGGPAPGGHNVIAGLYDAAKKANPQSRVLGLLAGPDGIIEGEYPEFTDQLVDYYRNLGGPTMTTTERINIRHIAASQVDASVVVSGDDSNTKAPFLVQELYDDGIRAIGAPKTIDGDIQVRDAERQSLRILIPIAEGRWSQ